MILVTSFLFIGLIYSIIKFRNRERGDYNNRLLGVIWILSVVLVVWLTTWITVYTNSLRGIARMDAFYRHTKGAYEYTITATKEVEISGLKNIKGSENLSMQMFDSGEFAYFKLAPVVSERITELRNKIESYNTDLELYKRWNSFWLTKGFIADVPSDLKSINFGES